MLTGAANLLVPVFFRSVFCQDLFIPIRRAELPPTPEPPLPLANSTSVVFDSRVSPPMSRAPVACYRIPIIVQTPEALVAFAEARIGHFDKQSGTFRASCDDCVVNGIAMRRSTDGGRTWGPYSWAVSDQSTDPSRPDMDIGGNPSAVYDKSTGKIVLQFVRGQRNLPSPAQSCNPAMTNWQQESFDSGQSWTKPVDISQYLGLWAGSLIGPSNGVHLSQSMSKYAGRLVWCGHWGVYNSTQVWYSDDHGATYKISGTVFDYMDECALAELSDGRVYLNMRNNHYNNYANGTSCDCRAFAVSEDGGANFGPLQFDPTLISPVCQATLSSAGGDLLFANPATTARIARASSRIHGTVRKSTDMGKSWSRSLPVTPEHLQAEDGGSYDYSCLLPDPLNDDPTQGGLLWSHRSFSEKGCTVSVGENPHCWLVLFSRFPLEF